MTIKTLNGRRDVRPDAVPSLFAWPRTSPRKRKAPVFQVNTEVNSPVVSMQSQVTSDEEPNDTCTLPTAKKDSVKPEDYGRRDVYTQTGLETGPENDCKTLMQQIIDQKSELEKANRHIDSLQRQLFTPERFKEDDAAIRFYTGFPNWSTFMAIFNYLDPGIEGQNIRYGGFSV